MTAQGNKGKRGPKGSRNVTQYVFDDYEAGQLLLDLAIGIALQGGALRIGLTRDGGALALGVYKDNDYQTEYIRPGENLAQELREIAMGWEMYPATYDDEAGRWIVR